MCSKASAARITVEATSRTPAPIVLAETRRKSRRLAGTSMVPALAADLASDEVSDDDEPPDQSHHERGRDEREAPLDELSDRLPEPIEEGGNEKEAHAARDDRGGNEYPEVKCRGAAGNGDELVGNRRHPLDENDPQPPFVVGG